MPALPATITIIDDDESVRRALRRLIVSLGFNAETFETSEKFLESVLGAISPAGTPAPSEARCLILDVHLPGLSGLELQRRLHEEGRNLPIVFITAYPDDQARDQAMQGGAIAFLYKPFEQQALLDAVQKGLAQSRLTNGFRATNGE
jgi:FixJ family two-component response regulator